MISNHNSAPEFRHETNFTYVVDLAATADEAFLNHRFAEAGRLYERLAGILSDKASYAGTLHRWVGLRPAAFMPALKHPLRSRS